MRNMLFCLIIAVFACDDEGTMFLGVRHVICFTVKGSTGKLPTATDLCIDTNVHIAEDNLCRL